MILDKHLPYTSKKISTSGVSLEKNARLCKFWRYSYLYIVVLNCEKSIYCLECNVELFYLKQHSMQYMSTGTKSVIVTKYNISNIIKGFYIVSPFFTRLSKDTLIEYTSSTTCCVAPNVPVILTWRTKFCAVSSIVGYDHVFHIFSI
jgi:hypothetical protein